MSEFMPEPYLVLPDMESVRNAVKDDLRSTSNSVDRWRIKSLWLVQLIEEIIATRKPALPRTDGALVIRIGGDEPIAYNAEVKKLAELRLGMAPQSDAYYAREGDTLSLLVYNAQNYRRSDKLRADGFEPASQSLLDSLPIGTKIETRGGKEYVVREVDGKRYAMQARKRKYAMSVDGCPVRVVRSLVATGA